MAKITIKELYYGDKYAVMSEVFKTIFLTSPNKAGVDEQTALELEIVRQTLIALEKMKKNGDCIAELNPKMVDTRDCIVTTGNTICYLG